MSDRWQDLQSILSLEAAMPELLPSRTAPGHLLDLGAQVCSEPPFAESPALRAALWLYLDDLERSHTISQAMHSPLGPLWHGIMHRREGDFWNAKYWLRQASPHPAFSETGHDPIAFVDQVERAHCDAPSDLVTLQRQEWQTLFTWCLKAHP